MKENLLKEEIKKSLRLMGILNEAASSTLGKDIIRALFKNLIKNDIDNFVLHKIEEEGLHPAKEADKETLIRRLSFDIRGISPDVKEVDAFLNDKDPLVVMNSVLLLSKSPLDEAAEKIVMEKLLINKDGQRIRVIFQFQAKGLNQYILVI